MKHYTDITASYFQSLGIGRGDMVMLILKRRYEFWFSIIALHKLGATVIPATHLLTKKDIVYRCNAADIKMIVAAGEEVITKHIIEAMPDCPTVHKLVSVGPEIPEGFEDFHFHMLRHTFTSNLLSNGAAPKDVQELLGHADVSTTMNIYAHSKREAKRTSARLLDKVVGEA